MKNIIKNISLGLFMGLVITSCDNDDYFEEDADIGGYAFLADQEISVFDTNSDITIDLFTAEGVNVEEVEILQDSSVIATATISDSTATFNSSALGALEAGSYPIQVRSTLSNGEIVEDSFSIMVADAIELDGDNPTNVRFMDTTSSSLAFTTFSQSATIDNVSLFQRTNQDTTFTDTGMTFDVTGGEINLGEIDYEGLGVGVGDTIFYRFEAQSGDLNQAVETQVVIQTQDFGSSTATTLSNDPTMAGFNLSDGTYAAAGETGELMFMDPSGFSTMEGMDFVEVTVPEDMTASEYISSLDLFEAEMIYEGGDPMTSVAEVEMDDIYIYKTTRDGMDSYGIIQVGNVTSTTVNGEETTSFDLNYMEGSIIRE